MTAIEQQTSLEQAEKPRYANQASSFLLERASAIITWLVVTGFSIGLLIDNGSFPPTHIVVASVLCITYLALWLYATTNDDCSIVYFPKLLATVVLFFNVIAIYFVIPYSFVAIFMVLFSAISPYYMRIKLAFLISPLWSIPLYLIYAFYWQQNSVLITAFLFWTFNIFALVMVSGNLREREARIQVEEANSKLIATQSLLNEAVKQSERVRIARNIHDLLGHHLTALTINLQVASLKTEGEVKENIVQCHQLAKLLLSDVREAVSDIRDKGKLDLEASIQDILRAIPTLNAVVDVHSNVNISDIHIADTIIKCVQESITNALRHANGKHMSIELCYTSESEHDTQQQLALTIENDGKMPSNIIMGNGLTGIKERLSTIQGKADFVLNSGKFLTRILIPVPQHD